MKYLILIVSMYTFMMPVTAQKVVKTNDFNLSEFEKVKSPAQLIGLNLSDDGKIAVYSLKEIWGVLKVQKDAYKSGMPYFTQQTFDANLQRTATDGSLMLAYADPKRKYIFEPASVTNGLTKEMEIKTYLPDLSKTIGLQVTNKVFESADIVSSYDAVNKKNVVSLSTTSRVYEPDNQGIMYMNPIKAVGASPKAEVAEKLAASPTSKTLLLSPTVFQKVLYEVKAGDELSPYMYFRLITMTDKGVLTNDENINLPNIKELQTFIPMHNSDAETKGSLMVFQKKAYLGFKSKKDPIDGNKSLFVSDENGKIWAKFDHQHAEGKGVEPFNAYAALMKNDKLHVLNGTIGKIGSSNLFETVVFDKTGKAETTHSIIVKESKPQKIGKTKLSLVTDAVYSQLLKGENGVMFLIGHGFTKPLDVSLGNGGPTTVTEMPIQYNDIFIMELDADFKYKTHTVIGLPASAEKAKIDVLEQKAGKITLTVSAKSGTDVIVIEGSKITALTDIVPAETVTPILSEWSKNYVYDAKNSLIHYFFQSVKESNKGKIVSVSLLP
jgi:hypothetical protein